MFAASEKFQSFGNFELGNEIDNGAEDANGVAGFFEAVAIRGRLEETGKTRSQAGTDSHGYAIAGNGGSVNPGRDGLNSEVVDEETGLEVVGAIDDEIKAREQLGGIARVQVPHEAFDVDTAIDGAQFALGGNGFGEGGAGVVFVEESLALQVRGLDKIAVQDSDTADSGTHEKAGGSSTDRAATDDDGAGSEEALLAFFADSGEEHLTRVLFLKRIEQARTRWDGGGDRPPFIIITLEIAGRATPLCYASSER